MQFYLLLLERLLNNDYLKAKKNLRMRGQAFIVFEDIESAQKAVSSMQGFPFHDKKMRIAFAKVKSRILNLGSNLIIINLSVHITLKIKIISFSFQTKNLVWQWRSFKSKRNLYTTWSDQEEEKEKEGEEGCR